MHHNISQDLEASSGQERSKLGKTNGFRIRQMQNGEAQGGRNICQHWDKIFRSTRRQGVSDSTLDSSLGKRYTDKAKTLRNEGFHALCPRILNWYLHGWNELGPWRFRKPIATLHWKVWLNALGMMSVPSGNSLFGYAPGRLEGWGADEVVMESIVLWKFS